MVGEGSERAMSKSFSLKQLSTYLDGVFEKIGAVRKEVEDGIVSIEAAREVYGVAVDAETFELLSDETARLRGRGGE